jgi:hypothetical protein
MVQAENISMNHSDIDEEEANNHDRELIAEFMVFTRELQSSLQEMESNNEEMTALVAELISDKKSPANQKVIQD